jgi:gamma-glutamyl-gamma-aminobutyrate hydrolase PuuD
MQYEQRPRIGIPCAHVEPEQGKFLPIFSACRGVQVLNVAAAQSRLFSGKRA